MAKLFQPTDPELVANKQLFADEGLNPHPSKQQPDWMPLHWFSVTSDPDFSYAQAWVESGGCVDVQTDAGDTPLHLATWNGRFDRVEWLVALGANPNVPNAKGNTPIHQCFRRQQWESAALLIEAGVDWSAQDTQGISTLGHAVSALDLTPLPSDGSPKRRVWEAMRSLPRDLWEQPCSKANPAPLLDRVPHDWQSRLQDRWLSQSLPSPARSRPGLSRL